MGRPVRKTRKKTRAAKEPPAERLIRTLAACCINPASLLELYYWSREPGLAEIVRGIATMPEEARSAIEAFVVLARDTKSVSAELDGRGVLTLASLEAARAIVLAQHLAEDTHGDLPRVLN
jgi:hypothetical protein